MFKKSTLLLCDKEALTADVLEELLNREWGDPKSSSKTLTWTKSECAGIVSALTVVEKRAGKKHRNNRKHIDKRFSVILVAGDDLDDMHYDIDVEQTLKDSVLGTSVRASPSASEKHRRKGKEEFIETRLWQWASIATTFSTAALSSLYFSIAANPPQYADNSSPYPDFPRKKVSKIVK